MYLRTNMSVGHIAISVNDNIASVALDMQGETVNKFSVDFFADLTNGLRQIESNASIQWVIFYSKKRGMFIAGADISEINQLHSKEQAAELVQRGQDVFNRVAKLSPKTVALIDGVALGGGLEFALACDYILATDSKRVKLGLPEVNLGIIPGWGGTQRLPKRIGIVAAIQMIVSGKPIGAKKAKRLGLVDDIVSSEFALDQCMDAIHAKRLIRRKTYDRFFAYLPFVQWVIFRRAKSSVLAKTKGMYPAPLEALNVLKQTRYSRLMNGLRKESLAIQSLMHSPITKQLVQLFFSQDTLKKQVRAMAGSPNRSIRHIGICGAGLMGGGIAWWFAANQCQVRLRDISWEMIQKGYQATQKIVGKAQMLKKIPKTKAIQIMDALSATLTYDGFESMDVVIEAVPESMSLKKQVFSELEAVVSPTTILATNTSALSVDEMASELMHPERFLGIHFFSPVYKMPLVEVIPNQHTDPTVIADVCQMVLKFQKVPIVVKNCPGFLINRILLPYISEAVQLVCQGYKVTDIDAIAEKFGMPIGPLALADEVGLDIGYKVLQLLEAGYGKRMAIPKVFASIVSDAQSLGKKTNRGFYDYTSDIPTINRDIYIENSIVMKHRISDQDESEILDRLMLVMINESSRCIEEGVVESAKMLDLAMIMGIGFPPFRGGILQYADSRGLGEIIQRLNQLSQSIHRRFKPSTRLVTLAKQNGKFHR